MIANSRKFATNLQKKVKKKREKRYLRFNFLQMINGEVASFEEYKMKMFHVTQNASMMALQEEINEKQRILEVLKKQRGRKKGK